MSHFTCLVLVNKDEKNPILKAEELLKPFDENIEVSEYERDCWCVKHPPKNGKCSDCNGTKKEKTTYNPNSQWDWYSLGGRWSGAIQAAVEGKDYVNCPDAPAYFQDLPSGGNIVLVSDLLDDKGKPKYQTFAVIEPNGNWVEKGKMGWWAMVADEKENWPQIYQEVLTKHKDCIALCYDLHI